MPEGNFAATLLFCPDATPATAALYSFVAALALDEALSQAAEPSARLSIKWPNDVLLNGGKVAGILLESVATGGHLTHLAIGIGVNLAVAPDSSDVEAGAVRPVSVFAETGLSIAPETFLSLLAQSFSRFSGIFQIYGFAPIREAWLARAARIGEKITARTGRETWTGIFETIDTTGAMILRTDDGTKVISAAEVFF